MKSQWRFTALDTLFFKESRPMEAIGGAQLQSVFPPPARTLIGAIRTLIGQAYEVGGVDWKAYASDKNHPLKAIIGSPEALNPLAFTGPFLLKDGQRLFPVPLTLLRATKQDAKQTLVEFTRLQPSDKITQCDLGMLKLPKKRDALMGAKPLENASISAAGLQRILEGGMPAPEMIIDHSALYTSEERLGIGRDHAKRTTADGLLYQTSHIRPNEGISIGIVVYGLSNAIPLPEQGTARLGAEGRLASWQREAVQTLPAVKLKNKRIVLVLLTHAKFHQGWLPDGFKKEMLADGQTVWQGEIHGISLRLICCVLGKPVREGGWDLVNRMPRAMDSLVPAGSCYFFEILEGQNASVLHGCQIGQDIEYGRGEVAIGNW